VALVEVEEHRVAERLHGGNHEGAAERAELRQHRPVAQEVLDLRRDVEAHVREGRVEGPRHGEGVPRAIEEVGVADRHVGRPGLDLLADVGQDHVRRDDEKAPAVDRRDGAVPAEVLEPRLAYVPTGSCPRRAERVLLEEESAAQLGRISRSGRRHGTRGRPHPRRDLGSPGRERLGERHEWRLCLAADHEVDAVGEQVLGVQLRIEPVGRDVTCGVHGADALDQRDADPERGVHRHGHGDARRATLSSNG
jgi:hypothetical protein